MRPLSSISGHLKRQLRQLGWRQWRRSKYWKHPDHPYLVTRCHVTRSAKPRPIVKRAWEQIDGYTLRTAARRARILPKGF